jgi:hypothetical protein
LKVFEPFFVDGLEAGPSAKRGVFIFSKKFLCRESLARPSAKAVFLFFEKNLCREPPAKAVGKDGFLF